MTSWAQLTALFKQTKAQHARIDHVFLNAGLGPRTDYLATDVDENGDLREPSTALLDVSLKGVMNTGTLAIYYMRQQPEGGSIVVNASVMGIQRCRAVDYGGSFSELFCTFLSSITLASSPSFSPVPPSSFLQSNFIYNSPPSLPPPQFSPLSQHDKTKKKKNQKKITPRPTKLTFLGRFPRH